MSKIKTTPLCPLEADTRFRVKCAEVRSAGQKGRGLYALRFIKKDELVEQAAGLYFDSTKSRMLLSTPIFDHLLANPNSFANDHDENTYALTMGDMTFCNHSPENNAVIEWSFDTVGLWLCLRSLKDIAEGEEITIKYTNLSEYGQNIL